MSFRIIKKGSVLVMAAFIVGCGISDDMANKKAEQTKLLQNR